VAATHFKEAYVIGFTKLHAHHTCRVINNKMRLALACLAAAVAQGGVIQGVVLEHSSGLPLARTRVRLDAVLKNGAPPVRPIQAMTNRTGGFIFPAVPDGMYLLSCQRAEYFPAAHGQRRPNGQGTAVVVTPDSTLFAELRMRRMGAITGRILDENSVGIANVPVVAYRARLPLRVAAHAVADDRGIYRIHGLDPGKYWVRSEAYTLEDGSGLLPTFAPQSRETRDARAYDVRVDEETADADIRPEFGTLFHLTGKILCPAGPVAVTLSSDVGRRVTAGACGRPYTFQGLAPGAYEVFATSSDETQSGFAELFLDRDSANGDVQLIANPQVDFEARRPGSTSPIKVPMKISGRRQDLAEADTEREINALRSVLAPGHWEMRAAPGPGQYIESIANFLPSARRIINDRPTEWFDVQIQSRLAERVIISISDQAGTINGAVVADGKSVPAAPVFLWPVSEGSRRSLGGPKQVLSDTEGQFSFDALPPGDYRLLATFDVSLGEIDADLMESAHAQTLPVASSQRINSDVRLILLP